MDEDVTRLAIHSEEPKIILHGSGNYHACVHFVFMEEAGLLIHL